MNFFENIGRYILNVLNDLNDYVVILGSYVLFILLWGLINLIFRPDFDEDMDDDIIEIIEEDDLYDIDDDLYKIDEDQYKIDKRQYK